MLQPFGVERKYLHKAQLGLYVYNVRVRDCDLRACMDERVAKALLFCLFKPKIKIFLFLF